MPLLLLLTSSLLVRGVDAQPRWPAVTAETRPWTRWWWHGSAVDAKNLTANLESYRAAGLGGVEITPIYGVRGGEDRYIPFLSQEWMAVLRHTLSEARRLGMGVDMANGTGWPFGGPWVSDAHASRTLQWRRYRLRAGERLAEPVRYHREAWARSANPHRPLPSVLSDPPVSNPDLQVLALEQVHYAGDLRLEALMAYDGKGGAVDLTAQVDPQGRLAWSPASGEWELYAVFSGLHGKMVERAAPGGEGYAIDHFSGGALAAYLRRFDSAFRGHDLSHLRGFFNDSYEVDDARGQADWTPGLFEAFRASRGYDLRDHLPALLGRSDSARAGRVLYDYRSLIGERILNQFTEPWAVWGHAKGKILRNQSHGSPANTLDLYAAVDIPETEGTEPLRFRFASSAAHVTGKRLVSAEAATWLDEHFLSTLGDVKKSVDNYFLGGVNHIVYHGTAYSPIEAPWPGRLFYASVHFQPTDPQWRDFDALNRYVTRVQSFLQQGRPANDVLVHYPLADRLSSAKGPLLQHFDGMARNFEGTPFAASSDWMAERGFGFDFYSDRQLQGFQVAGSRILTGGNPYRAILLPGLQLIEPASMRKLLQLSEAGATVLVLGELPKDVPGLHRLEERRDELRRMLGALDFRTAGDLRIARHGRGRWLTGPDMGALLAAAGIRPDPFTAAGYSSVSRTAGDRRVSFVVNASDTLADTWVRLPAGYAKALHAFDPMTGDITVPATRKQSDGSLRVRLQLRPRASLLLQTAESPAAPRHSYELPGGGREVHPTWSIRFEEPGPFLPESDFIGAPALWHDKGHGPANASYAGSAIYSTEWWVDIHHDAAWTLDLGEVHATAEVILNGKSLGKAIGPSYSVRIPKGVLKMKNRLDVVVSNTMANRIAYMDREGIPWKVFHNIDMAARRPENRKGGVFDASAWKPVPSGLLGPVMLIPHEGYRPR
jgi:hypothetical protein